MSEETAQQENLPVDADTNQPPLEYGSISEAMAQSLISTGPWLRFLAVVSFISLGSLFFSGLVLFVGGFLPGEIFREAGFPGMMAPAIGAIYILAAALTIFPALFTFRFGEALKSWKKGFKPTDLESALKNNAALWKFNGIVTIVYLSLIILFLIIGIGVIVFILTHQKTAW